MSILHFISVNASGGIDLTVDNFDSLPVTSHLYALALVKNEQGTKWLPGTIGGSYKPSGLYYFDGTNWINDDKNLVNKIIELDNEKLDSSKTFEQFNLYINNSSSKKDIIYNNDNIESIKYLVNSNEVTKLFSYDSDQKLENITLSGSIIPSDLDKIKKFKYDVEGNLIDITYSS